MEGQTELILEALGQRDLAAMLSALVRNPASEGELTNDLTLGQSVASRGLKHLRIVGLVTRAASRGKYEVAFPAETRSFLEALDHLATRIVEARVERDAWVRAKREST
jgi:predicted transcriptional regulator